MDLQTDQQTNQYGIVQILDILTTCISTQIAFKSSRNRGLKKILSIC